MTTIARKVFKLWNDDNMVFDRLIEKSAYQEFFPVGKCHDYDANKTAYIYEDGSALRVDEWDNWEVITNFGIPDYIDNYI